MRKQLGRLGRVRHEDEIGVSDQYQHWHLDGPELVVRPSSEAVNQGHRLLSERLEMGWVGRHRCVGVPHGGEIGLRRESLWVNLAASVVPVVSRGDHRPADTTLVVDEQLVGGQASEAEFEQVCLLDAEVVEQAHHVGGEILKGDGPVDVGGTAVALKLDGDDPVMLGQGGDDRSEAELDREQASVEENERRSQSVLLKIEMNPVDIGVRHTGRDDTKNFNSSRPG